MPRTKVVTGASGRIGLPTAAASGARGDMVLTVSETANEVASLRDRCAVGASVAAAACARGVAAARRIR